MFSAEICALGTQNNVVNVSRSIAVGRGNGINDKLLSFYVVICEKKNLSLLVEIDLPLVLEAVHCDASSDPIVVVVEVVAVVVVGVTVVVVVVVVGGIDVVEIIVIVVVPAVVVVAVVIVVVVAVVDVVVAAVVVVVVCGVVVVEAASTHSMVHSAPAA